MAMINSRKTRFGGPIAAAGQGSVMGNARSVVDPSLLSFISANLKKSQKSSGK